MLVITGTLERIAERKAGPRDDPSKQWDEQELVIADYGVTHYAKVGRDFGALPERGESVAVAVSEQPYYSQRSGRPGVGFTALHRVPVLERGLQPSAPASIKSA
jgi:hypothetical protein